MTKLVNSEETDLLKSDSIESSVPDSGNDLVLKLNQLIEKIQALDQDRKKFSVQQLISVGLDLIKFLLAGFVVLMILTTQTGQQVSSKILPLLGFGNAAQTNLGLQLLVNQMDEESFHQILKEITKKIDYEIAVIFSADSIIPPEKRLELLRQVKGYAFSSIGADLEDETKLKLKNRYLQLEVESLEAINYSLSLAIAQGKKDRERILKEMKILLMNRKYVELFEKSLPLWYTGREIVKLSLVSMVALDTETPEILDKILNNPVIYQRSL